MAGRLAGPCRSRLAWRLFFPRSLVSGLMAYWYQFALVFEALFILTTIDTGTRVGRYLIQEMGGHFYPPLRRMNWWPGVAVSSGLIVGAWGYLIGTGASRRFGRCSAQRISYSAPWHLYWDDGTHQNAEGAISVDHGVADVVCRAITLIGSYEMFGMFVSKASSLTDRGQAFALYLDAGLVAFVALLAVIVLGDSIRQWYGYVF